MRLPASVVIAIQGSSGNASGSTDIGYLDTAGTQNSRKTTSNHYLRVFCRATGIARATLDRYYNDRVNSFDREVLAKLCDYLQVEPGELIVKLDQGDLFAPLTSDSKESS